MKVGLSERERAVITFAVRGYTDEMIAQELGIMSGTVNSYWTRIRGKLGNFSRSELVARFVQKNADLLHSDYVVSTENTAAALADENREILAKANEEIEKLKLMLEKANEHGD